MSYHASPMRLKASYRLDIEPTPFTADGYS